MPEQAIIEAVIKGASVFGLLAFVVYAIVGLLRTLVEHNTKMAEQLVATNATLADALKNQEFRSAETAQVHQEQTLLIKMTLDKVSEIAHGQ
jgi:hypothetical protein